MAQNSAGKHDQWQGTLTVLVINYAILKFIWIPTAVICPMIKHDAEKQQDCFCREVKWALAIHWQVSTLFALDLGHVYYIPHAQQQEKDTYSLPEGN